MRSQYQDTSSHRWGETVAAPAGAASSSNFAALPIVGGVGVLGATGAGAYVYVGQAMQKARLEQAKRKLQEQYEKDPRAIGWLFVQKPFEAPSLKVISVAMHLEVAKRTK